jgi:hypothetical protein
MQKDEKRKDKLRFLFMIKFKLFSVNFVPLSLLFAFIGFDK